MCDDTAYLFLTVLFYFLQVTVSDNGVPPLASTTRVVVSVGDINDHTPEFDQPFYKVLVPATDTVNVPVYQVCLLTFPF